MDRETAYPTVQSLPGENATDWIVAHQRTAATSTYVYEFVWDITEDAIGPFCTDADGNVFLDFTSHVAAAPLGYNNPKLTEKLEAFPTIDPTKIAGQDFYVSGGGSPTDTDFPGPTQLMDRITDATAQYGLETVFLSNSGAEAVENAIKICYDAREGAKHGITFRGAFHGRTLGALSLNRSQGKHRRHFPEISGVHDVPYCRDSACTRETCGCGFFPGTTDSGESLLDNYFREGGPIDPTDTAYIILEPIQGEGGFYMPSETFMAEIADVCDTYDIPVIADEIQSGIGRTGKMWAVDHYELTPDVITAGKGLRVGATTGRTDLFPDETGRLSSTWGAGDTIAALQGVLTLEAIDEYDLLSNATERGDQLADELRDRGIQNHATDIRYKGLMFGVEFADAERRDAVQQAALEHGLLTLGCGRRTLRLLPPLDVTAREIRIGAELLMNAVTATASE